MKKIEIKIIILLCFFLCFGGVRAQEVENSFQTRTEFKTSLKLSKKWKLQFTPELRFDENFDVSKYLFELKGIYKPIKNLSFGASYLYIINPRPNNPTEYLSRYAFDVEWGKDFKRWESSFRLKYTNYSEDITNGNFLRYKAELGYDIKNSKLTPVISTEAYQELSDNELYKMRYGLGAKYKLNKKNAINFGYKLDYYLNNYQNKHILYLGYKIKF